jgi:Zn-dependent M28 family amino/carboxypeptidase
MAIVDMRTMRVRMLRTSRPAIAMTSHRHRSGVPVERSTCAGGIEGRMRTRPTSTSAWLMAALVVVLSACNAISTASPSSVPVGSDGASLGASGAINPADIRADLEALQGIADANGGLRVAGTAGYVAAVEYVAGRLRDLGYAVQTPEFEMATFAEAAGSSIEVGAGGPTFAGGPDFHAMIYSASGEISAPVVEVGYGEDGSGGCRDSDFNRLPAGAIALTPPGPCFRRDAVLNAVEAGASALVSINPNWAAGEVRRPTLLEPDGIEIPALAASREVGDALRAAAASHTEVRISVRTEIGQAMVPNLIAESHGVGEKVLILGGHLDGVHDGPGMNDNGSGVAALLEVARVLAEAHPAVRVRFAFWAGEEFGLFGSRAYVETLRSAERAEILAYLNLDMIGSPNFVPMVYDSPTAAAGSAAITDFLVSYLRRVGIGAEPTDIGASSDHAPFDAFGIPTGGIFGGATEVKTAEQAEAFGGTAGELLDPCYHLACDTVANVEIDHVAIFAEAALALTLAMASGQLTL